MNIIGVDSLSCDTSELNDLQKKLYSKYKNDLSNKQITISSLKEINDTDFQYKSSHINCLAGFTTIVMKSNKEIIPCDMVDHVLYKWEKYGDLEKGFNIGKEKWMNLKCSWCEKCLKY